MRIRTQASPRRLRARPGALVPAVALATALVLGCLGDGTPRGERDLPREGLSNDVVAAIDVVERLHAAMIGIMERGPDLGYTGRFAAIEAVVRVSFNLPAMARASFGPEYAELSPEQKTAWVQIFERFHISSLADVRGSYQGQTYRILDWAEPASGVVLVRTKLDYPGRNVDLYTDYRLRRMRSGWRIVDVHSPPSVSEVAMRRAEYRTVLDRSGFDGLIEEMEARIRRRERP